MRVLVTGGLGVNGSWVTRKLVQGGHEVVVLDTTLSTILVPDVADDIELIEGDIRDLDGLTATLKDNRIERIVHMAAIVQGFQDQPHLTFQVNAMGTVTVLEAAVRAEVPRVVFASSRAVYGSAVGRHAHPEYLPFTEDSPVRPALVYETCKVAAETMALTYCDRFGLDFVALRFAHIIGPGKSLRYGGHSVPGRIIEEPLAGRAVAIERGGEQRDDVIYVEDAAEGVILAVLSELPGHRVYNISRNVATTLHELADAVRRHVPGAQITIGPGLDYFGVGPQWYGPLDNTRAREELGFVPRFDLDEMVGAYIHQVNRLGLATVVPR